MTTRSLVVAVTVPLVVAAVLGLLREWVPNTSMALVLVLVVVAVALRGDRWAGIVASVVSAAAFDFFLTAPVHSFAIVSAVDVQTAVILLVVGLVVTELAQWGRRELERGSRREGYVTGLTTAARLATDGAEDLPGMVARTIAEVLDLDDCRFVPGPPSPDRPRMHPDGSVTLGGRIVDVEREGLPVMDVVELPARGGAGVFVLTASTRVRRPDAERCRVAATLAEQVGAGSTTRNA